MANMREIRLRIKSIQDIMKITNAMYLISSSKLRKARKKLNDVEPYFVKIQATIADILRMSPNVNHKFFDERPHIKHKKRGYIVMTADKGLAGAYNHNVIKLAEQQLAKHRENTLFVVGQVGRKYFQRKHIPVDGEFLYTAQNPNLYRARSIAETVVDLFEKGYLDEFYVIYTDMVSTTKLEPAMIQLLPLQSKYLPDPTEDDTTYARVATYSPSPEDVLNHLVPNYVKGIIYSALIESYSSEHSARMTAMDAATTSAKDMIKSLTLMYNRARQASITQEISEIVGGAKSFHK